MVAPEVEEEEAEVEREGREYERSMEEEEREARAEYIQSRRCKSRLTASHRQVLQGLPPNMGNLYEMNSGHRSKEHKRALMGRYGRAGTGVSPATCWPTGEQVHLAREWEALYQEKPLKAMIEEARREVEERRAAVLAREAEVVEALGKMERQVRQWEEKRGAKARLLDSERERRERVLAELRLEFGYNINPEDNYMKTRIGEREKVLIKEEKEKKKQEKATKMAARKLEEEK